MTTIESRNMKQMKRIIAMLLSVSLLIIMMSACSQMPAEQKAEGQTAIPTIRDAEEGTEAKTEAETEKPAAGAESLKEETSTEPEEAESPTTEQTEQPKEEETMNQTQFYITANGITFTADFTDNDSTETLRELLRDGDLTISMSDYGGFEKVGSIGTSLPRKDTQISTTTGDIMLYQGDQIVIFYGTNSWSYSRLGRIEDADAEALLSAFGSGNVDITFSLTAPQ